jgi:hypothetical protein
VGDNFVVFVESRNSEGVDFFILKCTNPMYTMQEERKTDGWGETLESKDEVVDGYHYKQQGAKQISYVFLKETNFASILSHLMC